MLRTEGSQERLDNLAELKQSVYEYETTCGEEVTLEHYLAHVALFTNADTAEQGDKVRLMTVHAAKGLEFPAVIIAGVRKYSIPMEPEQKKREEPGKITAESEEDRLKKEEERRLFYVGMTRAKEELVLLTSGEPSVFLSELPEEALLRETVRGPGETGMKQLSLFDFM